MPLETYRWLHIVGLVLTVMSFGIMACIYSFKDVEKSKFRAAAMALHGVGLVLLIISGFGMLAKLQLFQALPIWAYMKIGIWLLVGGVVTLFKRKSAKIPAWTLLLLVLFATAAYLGINKPL